MHIPIRYFGNGLSIFCFRANFNSGSSFPPKCKAAIGAWSDLFLGGDRFVKYVYLLINCNSNYQ